MIDLKINGDNCKLVTGQSPYQKLQISYRDKLKYGVSVFNLPPTSKVIWRRGHSLESHPTDWRSQRSRRTLGTRWMVYALQHGGSYFNMDKKFHILLCKISLKQNMLILWTIRLGTDHSCKVWWKSNLLCQFQIYLVFGGGGGGFVFLKNKQCRSRSAGF